MLLGVAWNIPSLVIFSILQGAAAGILMLLVTTLMIRITGDGGSGKHYDNCYAAGHRHNRI
jgi:MFS family permease